MDPLYLCAALGFLSVGFYKYILHPNWNVKSFLATEPRKLGQAILLTTVTAYFARDVAAILPKSLAGVNIDLADILTKAPKFAGFMIGVVFSGTDAAALFKSIVGSLPMGEKILAAFEKKPGA